MLAQKKKFYRIGYRNRKVRKSKSYINLVIQVSSNLSEFAVSLDDVLNGGALHHEGVLPVGLDDLLDALVVR